jgi:thiol:disulfide interchange protein DsbA
MKPVPCAALIAFLILSGSSVGEGVAPWTEGKHYFLIVPPQPTSVPRGKVEVTEVFSYGCPACNRFVPVMHKLKLSLPASAVVNYVPASFNPSEDWPMFQRAYITAQVLGVADKAHDAMFDAIWKTGQLAIFDPSTRQLKAHLPTIEDAARFYNRTTGVSVEDFVATANSMGVNTRVERADDMVMRYRVDGTPTMIVNGKYRLGWASAGGDDQLIELVKWLVAKEKSLAAPPR